MDVNFGLQVLGGGAAVGQQTSQSLLFKLSAANMNTTADQALVKLGSFSAYIIDKILVQSASTSLTTAVGGIYTGATKSGVTVVGAGQTYSGLVNSNSTIILNLANTDRRTESGLFLSLTTPQGVAATAEFLVYGYAVAP